MKLYYLIQNLYYISLWPNRFNIINYEKPLKIIFYQCQPYLKYFLKDVSIHSWKNNKHSVMKKGRRNISTLSNGPEETQDRK